MKIGFPLVKKLAVGDLEFDSTLHGCEYFGVFDMDNKLLRIKKTIDIHGESQENGLLQFLKQKGISTIVCPECHPMAAKYFVDNNIGIYKAQSLNVLNSIKEYQNNKLEAFSAENTLARSGCNADCNSCTSTCDEVEQEVVAI